MADVCCVCEERPADTFVTAYVTPGGTVVYVEPWAPYCCECRPPRRTADGGVVCLVAAGEA